MGVRELEKIGYSNFRKFGDYCFEGLGGMDKNLVILLVFIVFSCFGGY